MSDVLAALGYSPMGRCPCGAEAKRMEADLDGGPVAVCDDHSICPDCGDMCTRDDRCGRPK